MRITEVQGHEGEHGYLKMSGREWGLVASLVLLALAFRVFMLRYEYVPSQDGIYYATLGRNLVSGNLREGLSTYWPPLYPLLSGISSLIFRDLELGGRLVSVLAGSLLVIPVYLWVRNTYGRDAATVGAILIIFYPSLLHYSTKVLTESTYTLLFITGIIIGYSALSKNSRILFFPAGLVFGACYLIRPEAFGFMGLMVALTLSGRFFNDQLKFKRILLNNLILVLGFVGLSFPYILYLHQETGRWILTEKLEAHFPTMGEDDWFTLSKDGGLTLADQLYAGNRSDTWQSDQTVQKDVKMSVTERLRLIIPWMLRGLKEEYEVTIPKVFPPLIILLCGIGLFRTRWLRPQATRELYVMLFLVTTLIGYGIVWPDTRYLVPLSPIVIFWVANGIVELDRWLVETAEGSRTFLFKNRKLMRCLLVAVVVLSLMPSITYPMRGNKLDQPLEQKRAAMWIKDHSSSVPLIMSTGPWAAFYSGGRHLYLPDEEYSVVIESARRKKVNFIIIDERLVPEKRPHLKFLLDEQSQHPELKLVYKYKDDEIPNSKLLIFELVDHSEPFPQEGQ